MYIINFLLIFFSYIILNNSTRDTIKCNAFRSNHKINGSFKRNLLEVKNNDKKNNTNKLEDQNKKYEEYLQTKGNYEFEKMNYKYMEYVHFTINKKKNKFKHTLNEFLVFLGAQYEEDEKIVIYVKLIDIISLLFIHFKDNLSDFDHIINSFQDRNKFLNSVETEYLKEYIDERDFYIFNLKNVYFKINYLNQEKEQILSKKKKVYEVFLKNWKNDGYCFHDIHDKKSSYFLKKIDFSKSNKSSEEKNQTLKSVYLVCDPVKEKKKNLNVQVQKINKSSSGEVSKKEGVNEDQSIKKDSNNNKGIKDSIMIEPDENETCEIVKDRKMEDKNENYNESSVTCFKMKKRFFLNGNPLNIIDLINYTFGKCENEVVSKLYEILKELEITTFEHIVRYTNIIGIFFAYDIFDELYLQIKLIKDFFKSKEFEDKHILETENEKNTEKKERKFYGPYEMSEEETFVAPNCLTAYCKLKSVWNQNKNFNVKIEKSNADSINFMTVGDIGYGFENEKKKSLEKFLNFFGFNELNSTAETMQKWHNENKADFVVNLGDNVPKFESKEHTENFEWYKLIKKLFVFKKVSELHISKSQENQPTYIKSIVDFYSEKLKGIVHKSKNKENISLNQSPEIEKISEDHNKFIESNMNSYDEDKEYEEPFEAIPFYSIFGEKDYLNFPSEQIQEHYSNKIPGYFMPNNYYSVDYEFTFNALQGSDINSSEKFKASFIFIDTWSLMIGFPIIRNYRSFREQFNWLSKTLRDSAKESDWIFVFGHHPLVSSGRRSDCFSYEERSFHDIIRNFLFRYHVDAYFSGHDHLMEHIKYGKVDLFVNGSSSRIIFDDSKMSRGFFGKILGKIYPISCYVLKTIHRGLKPKGCTINNYSKWHNKSDIGFTAHKLTKKEFITEFINGRNGKPISEKIVLKNKKHERKMFYDLDGYADDIIVELEQSIKKFISENPELIKYKIEEFKENTEKLNLILKSLKTEREKDIFNKLIFLNNMYFDVSEYIEDFSINTLKTMYQMSQNFKVFFNKELVNSIKITLEKAIQNEQSKTHDSNEEKEFEDDNRDEQISDEDASDLMESLGIELEDFIKKYDSMSDEQKEFLQNQIGKDVSLEDYVNKIKIYVKNKKERENDQDKKNNESGQNEMKTDEGEETEEEEKEGKTVKGEEEEKEDEENEGKTVKEEEKEKEKEKEDEGKEGKTVEEEEEKEDEGKEGKTVKEEEKEKEDEGKGEQEVHIKEKNEENKEKNQGNKDKNGLYITLTKESHMKYKNLAAKESKLSNENHLLLCLGSLKMYDEKKYSLNLLSKKEYVKEVITSNTTLNITPRRTFFHLSIELVPEIKRVISKLGGVGKKKIFFNLINKLYNEIMKLSKELDKLAV